MAAPFDIRPQSSLPRFSVGGPQLGSQRIRSNAVPTAVESLDDYLDFSPQAPEPAPESLNDYLDFNIPRTPGPSDTGYAGEAIKGVLRGGGRMVAETGLKGLAAIDPRETYRRDIAEYREDLMRVPTMDEASLEDFQKRIGEIRGIKGMVLRVTVRDLLSGKMTAEDIDATPEMQSLGDRELFREGERYGRAIDKALSVGEGWEDSVTVALSEGFGTFMGGVGLAMIPGFGITRAGTAAAGGLFTTVGIGEAADRAVAYDRELQTQGKEGLTDDQMILASIYGSGPGATDVLPIDVLLGKLSFTRFLPPAARRLVASAIARIGGIAAFEGVQEGGQEFLQNLIAREVYNPDQNLFEGLPESAALGGGVGGLVGTGKEIVTKLARIRGGRSRQTPPPGGDQTVPPPGTPPGAETPPPGAPAGPPPPEAEGPGIDFPNPVEQQEDPDAPAPGEAEGVSGTTMLVDPGADGVVAPAQTPPDFTETEAGLPQGEGQGNIPPLTSPSGAGQTSPFEGVVDSSVGEVEAPSDLGVRDTLIGEIDSLLNVPSRSSVVETSVVRRLDDPEIFEAVVTSIPVDVVNMLVTAERSADLLLNDVTVFKEALATNDDLSVRRAVIGAIVRVPTFPVAEILSENQVPIPDDSAAAAETSKGDSHVIDGIPADQSSQSAEEEELTDDELLGIIDEEFGEETATEDETDQTPTPKGEGEPGESTAGPEAPGGSTAGPEAPGSSTAGPVAPVSEPEGESTAGPSAKTPEQIADDLIKQQVKEREGEEKPKKKRKSSLAAAIRDYLVDSDNSFDSITDARAFAREKGFDAKPGTPEAKRVEEDIEVGIVLAARRIIRKTRDNDRTYWKLLDLYQRQPRLGTRTSESVAEQAYSTPVPLAFLASRLAGIGSKTKVLEPAAGNGALLLDASTKNATVNELNEARAESLRSQGFTVTTEDAADPGLWAVPNHDVVIVNPPFGTIKTDSGRAKTFKVGDNWSTSQVDHAIAFNALQGMVDNGRAVLLVGSVKEGTDQDRRKAYNSKSKREFYWRLYDQYNVTDHFTVAGDLYAKQGASWPVDVIVIEGRGKSSRPLPVTELPQIYNAWEELKGKLDDAYDNLDSGESPKGGGRPRGSSTRGPRVGGAGPGNRGGTGQPRDGDGVKPGTDDPGAVRDDDDRGQRPAGGEQPVDGPDGEGVGAPELGDGSGFGDEPVDVNDLLDVIDEEFQGSKPAPKTSGEALGEAGRAAGSGVKKAAAGLRELFNDRNKLRSGLAFDEEDYRRALPHFEDAWSDFTDAGLSVREAMRLFVHELRAKYGFTKEMLVYYAPSINHFIKVKTAEERERAKKENQEEAADARKKEEGQVDYKPRAGGITLGTQSPSNLATSMQESLASLEGRRGEFETWVPQAIGYESVEAMREALAAEQVDAVALAIDAHENGSHFIIGDQCVAGETRIYDPTTETWTAIEELEARGEPISVLSLTSEGLRPAWGSKPFVKGEADLYRVTFDDGRSITVTQGHRFLTPSGWRSLGDGLRAGHSLSSAEDLPAYSSDGSPSVRPEDDPRWSHIPSDYQADCSVYPYRGDERLPLGVDSARERLPSPSDAHGHIRPLSHEDVLGISLERSHQHQDSGHRAKSSSSPLETRDPSRISDPIVASDAKLLELILQTGRPSQQLKGTPHLSLASDAHGQQTLLGHDLPRHGDLDEPLPSLGDNTGWRSISSIEFVRHDKFYDLWVPGHENYVAEQIVNHNTGIGKGRFVAAMLRYALVNNFTPVFVTDKPNLYGDMMRDLDDTKIADYLGHKPKIFMTDYAKIIPLDTEAIQWMEEKEVAKAEGASKPPKRGKFMQAFSETQHNAALATLRNDDGAGRGKTYELIFTTYSQMAAAKSRANPDGNTDRRKTLHSLAPNSLFILDESHKASGEAKDIEGTLNAAAWFRDTLPLTRGAIFSSATYAKRPETMVLYAGTDMGKGVDDPSQLPELVQKGGVAMQQVVASMLAESGQYIRRERSFKGVDYDVLPVEIDDKAYEQFSDAVSKTYQFDRAFKESPAFQNWIDNLAMAASGGINVESADRAASSVTNFSGVMHNIIGQMLLSIKTNSLADQIIASYKAGEKPIITLANTMESFIREYATEHSLEEGDSIDLSFRDLNRRYLRNALRVKTTPPGGGNPFYEFFPVADLPGEFSEMYTAAQDAINTLNVDHLPVSPIDWLRYRLEDAGLNVGEITGRNLRMVYSGTNKAKLGSRSGTERSAGGRIMTVEKYRNRDGEEDEVHALIMNRSAATGISLHTDKSYKNHKKRHMFVAQAEQNIDDHMQVLGRPHRSGQVSVPRYTQAYADIPAEQRPAAILASKMASLAANTTASKKSKLADDAVVDFMNGYGDEIVHHWLRANPAERITTDITLGTNVAPGVAAKFTGRLTLFKPDRQGEIYDEIQAQYNALIAALDAAGENALEAKYQDLDAQTVARDLLKEEQGDSPFERAVYLDEVSVKATGKALPLSEIADRIKDFFTRSGYFSADDTFPTNPEEALGYFKEDDFVSQSFAGHWEEQHDARGGAEIAEAGTEKAKTKIRDELKGLKERWLSIAHVAFPGRTVYFDAGDSAVTPGIVMDIKRRKGGGRALSLGMWSAEIALPNNSQRIIVPFSTLKLPSDPADPNTGRRFELVPEPYAYDHVGLYQQLKDAIKEGRDTRYIVTGNVLAGYDITNGKGQIINYTDDQGDVRPGIMMPKAFDPDKFLGERPVRFKTAEQVYKFLQESSTDVTSRDDIITIQRDFRRGIMISMPAARAKGGKYFLKPSVREAFEMDELSPGMVKRGNRMVFESQNEETATRVIGALMKVGASLQITADQEIAERIIKGDAPEAAQARHWPEPPKPGAITRRIDMTPRELRNLERKIRGIVKKTVGDFAEVKTPDLIDRSEVGGPQYDADIAEFEEAGARVVDQPLGSALVTPDGEALIRIAMMHPDGLDVGSTAYHESWHAIEGLFLTKAEHKIIDSQESIDRARQAAGLELGVDPEIMEAYPVYEARAVAFQRYARLRNGGIPLKKTGLPRQLALVFEKIRRILKQINRHLTSQGYKTIDDLFEATYEGRMAEGSPSTGETAFRDVVGGTVYARPVMPSPAGIRHTPAAQTQRKLTMVKKGRDVAIKKLFEQNLPMRRFQEALERRLGFKLPTRLDTWVALKLYPGRAGERLIDLEKQFVQPIIDEMRILGIDEQQFDDYLTALHAEERNREIRRIDPSNDSGSGMEDATAQSILAHYANHPEMTALGQRVLDMNEEARELLLSSGLIDQDAYDAWTTKYQNYMPLRGHDEAWADRPLTGRGHDLRASESRRAFGRHDEAHSPLAYSIMQASQAIIRSEKNRVMQRLALFVNTYKSEIGTDHIRIIKAVRKKRINQATGLVEYYYVDPGLDMSNDNLFAVKDAGKKIWIEIKDPNLRDVFRGVEKVTSPLMVTAMGIARFYSGLQTQWSAEFPITNAIRDLQTGAFNLTSVDNLPLGTRARMMWEALKLTSVRAILQNIYNPQANARFNQWYEEYRLTGAKVSFITLNNIDRIQKKIKHYRKHGMLYRAGKATADLVSNLNTAVENGGRLSVYIKLRESGVPAEEAAVIVRDMTVDFNQHGEWGPVINTAYVFANASAQGTYRMAKTLAVSRKAQIFFASLTALGFSMSMLNYMLAGDDEEGNNIYEGIPFFEKERNLIIMYPFDKEGRYLKIPLGYGLNFPFFVGGQVRSVMWGEKDAAEATWETLNAGMNAFNPIGTAPTIKQFLAPWILDPFVQEAENVDWTGWPIYPTKFDWKKPDSQNVGSSTSRETMWIAELLNEATGGDVGKPGWIDWTPDVIEHYFDFTVGQAGKFLSRAWQTGSRIAHGEEWLPEKAPFVRRFYGEAGSSNARLSDFYDVWRDVEQARYHYRELRKDKEIEKAEMVKRDNRPELLAYAGFNKTVNALRKIRKAREAVESSDLATETKQKRYEHLDQQRDRLIHNALSAYNKLVARNESRELR